MNKNMKICPISNPKLNAIKGNPKFWSDERVKRIALAYHIP
jgi:hypothetical protein